MAAALPVRLNPRHIPLQQRFRRSGKHSPRSDIEMTISMEQENRKQTFTPKPCQEQNLLKTAEAKQKQG
jgi:hypothetical protein